MTLTLFSISGDFMKYKKTVIFI